MRKLFLFSSLCAMALMTACSSEEPVTPGNPGEDAAYGDSYLSISLEMPNAPGTRAAGGADNDADKYDNGTAAESAVENAVFLFFDANDKCIDVQNYDDIEWTKVEELSPNPYITKYGTKEIRLRSGLNYKQVAVVINATDEAITKYKSTVSLKDFKNIQEDYVSQIVKSNDPTKNGSNQLMSNSVYYDGEGYNTKTQPKEDDLKLLVPITADNIYTSEQRSTAGNKKPADKKDVEVFVERVVSRIDVTGANTLLDTFTIDGDKKKTISVYNPVTMQFEEVTVKPVLKGMTVTMMTPKSRLFKELYPDHVGYGNNTTNFPNAKDFEWNDPANKRSYWAHTPNFSKNDLKKYSWDEVEAMGLADIHQYIHPNTLDASSHLNEDETSMCTKVKIVAQLRKYVDENDEVGSPISLVLYGADYMEASNLQIVAGNLCNIDVRAIDWKNASLGFTEAEGSILQKAVADAFVENGLDGTYFTLSISNKDLGYTAKVEVTKSYSLTITPADFQTEGKYPNDDIKAILDDATATAALAAKANTVINQSVAATVAKMNERPILYWKDGTTYYYTTIKQQGFYGLTGQGKNYLNVVIRNHIYNVQLTGIFGLGTPVIDPGSPIDPQRPTPETPTYLQAKINILPWRIVTNNATIH